MVNEYATNLAKVKTAMDNRYENKQANKKDNISGDFTNDEVSYPTVRAVKQYIGAQGYLTQHQNLDNYVQKSQTEGLIKNDGTVMTLSSLEAQFDGLEIAITEKATPNTGALKTYQITQGSTLIGEIDTPKDFLVKSGSVKTAGTTLTSAESAAGVGQNEKYISLIINTKDDNSGTGTELIIPATGLVEDTTYDADNVTLELSSSTNTFKVKNNGIDTLQLKDASVTANKIDSTVKDSWLDNEDVDTRINQALSDLADLIDPPAIGGRTISLAIQNPNEPGAYMQPSAIFLIDANSSMEGLGDTIMSVCSYGELDQNSPHELTPDPNNSNAYLFDTLVYIDVTNNEIIQTTPITDGDYIIMVAGRVAKTINNQTPEKKEFANVIYPYFTVDSSHTVFDITLETAAL